ncbi:hypothetical protein HDU76_006106 [Blyttiomyces sp. JEL0837]|nr:hypothetical protein HDU76_006106 [Blyttiomyces sp. JEL0837]
MPIEILTLIFKNLDKLSDCARFASLSSCFYSVSISPHAVSARLFYLYGKHQAIAMACKYEERRLKWEAKQIALESPSSRKGKGKGSQQQQNKVDLSKNGVKQTAIMGKQGKTAGTSFSNQFRFVQRDAIELLINMGSVLSRALIQRMAIKNDIGISEDLRLAMIDRGRAIYGFPGAPKPALPNHEDGQNQVDDQDDVESILSSNASGESDEDFGIEVDWLSPDCIQDEILFFKVLQDYPRDVTLQAGRETISKLLYEYSYTPLLEDITNLLLRRLHALGADFTYTLVERGCDRAKKNQSGRINSVIALTCIHREAPPGEWVVYNSRNFDIESVFGIGPAAPAISSQTSSESLLPAAVPRRELTCYLTEDLISAVLQNEGKERDYRAAFRMLKLLHSYDQMHQLPTNVATLRTNQFPTLILSSFHALLKDGRHLAARALSDEFQLSRESLEAGVLSHFENTEGCYWPGGVNMVMWALNLPGGISESFRDRCMEEVIKGIKRPRTVGVAKSRLEFLYYRLSGYIWEDEEGEEGDSGVVASGASSSVVPPSLNDGNGGAGGSGWGSVGRTVSFANPPSWR